MMIRLFFISTLVWGMCKDNPEYIDDWGETCEYWKGKSCSLLPNARGASELGQYLLTCNCPSNCKVEKSECQGRDPETGERLKQSYPKDCPVCKEKKKKEPIFENACLPSKARKRGETCLFNYQCEHRYCCPHLRVCLVGDQDRLFMHELITINGEEKAKIIATPPTPPRRSCEPTPENLAKCLLDSAIKYGEDIPKDYDLRACNCKTSFLYLVYRNEWVPCAKMVPEENMHCSAAPSEPVDESGGISWFAMTVAISLGGALFVALCCFSIFYVRRQAALKVQEMMRKDAELKELEAALKILEDQQLVEGFSTDATLGGYTNVLAKVLDDEQIVERVEKRRTIEDGAVDEIPKSGPSAVGRRMSFVTPDELYLMNQQDDNSSVKSVEDIRLPGGQTKTSKNLVLVKSHRRSTLGTAASRSLALQTMVGERARREKEEEGARKSSQESSGNFVRRASMSAFNVFNDIANVSGGNTTGGGSGWGRIRRSTLSEIEHGVSDDTKALLDRKGFKNSNEENQNDNNEKGDAEAPAPASISSDSGLSDSNKDEEISPSNPVNADTTGVDNTEV